MAPSLPFELVIKVIENTYYLHADKFKADIKTLSACAAVCKQWSRFARTLLFFKINTIRINPRDFVKRISFLPSSGELGACIRSIALYSHPGPGLDFITALSYCPNLYELCLETSHDTVELTELEVARLVDLRMSIRALRLSFFGMEKSRVLYQLMAIWPSIQFLSTIVSPLRMAPLPPDRPPFSLYELSLRGFDRDLYPESIIRWLLPPVPAGQCGSLHILSIGTDRVCDTLMEYAPYLRSLRLSCHVFPSHELIERCSMLEELIFHGIPVTDVDSDSRALALPQTIEHLRIIGRGSGRNAFEPFAVAILRSSTPRLRQVSVNTDMSLHQRDVLVDLAKVCSDRGVALVLDSLRSSMWGWECPVPVDHFPRHRTIENLYRMNTGVHQ